jgi:hypothetical protein
MPRPKLPADERRTEVLQVRLTSDEKSEIEHGAAKLETSAGALMRESALALRPADAASGAADAGSLDVSSALPLSVSHAVRKLTPYSR